MLRVGVETEILNSRRRTGVQKALETWLQFLCRMPGVEVTGFFKTPFSGHVQGLTAVTRESFLPLPIWREKALPRAVEEEGIDVFFSPVTAFPLRLRCPVVPTIHELSWLDMGTHAPPLELGRVLLALGRASRIVCVSASTARQCVEIGRMRRLDLKGRIKVVRNGFIPPPHGDEPLHMEERPPLVLTIASPLKRKNLFFHLQVFSMLAKRMGNATYCLVGPEGRGRKRLLGYAKSLGISSFVEMPGYMSDLEKGDLLCRARVLLHLPLSEGFGFTPLEALSLGCVPVVSRRGGLPEILGKAGFFVDDLENPDEACKVLLEAMVNRESAEQRLSMGRERILARDPGIAARRLLEVLEGTAGR